MGTLIPTVQARALNSVPEPSGAGRCGHRERLTVPAGSRNRPSPSARLSDR